MFITVKYSLINTNSIEWIDCLTYYETDKIKIHMLSGQVIEADSLDALNIIMRLNPSFYEGYRGKYAQWSFAIHNLIAHPVMQIFHWLGLSSIGIRFHDWLIPSSKRLLNRK